MTSPLNYYGIFTWATEVFIEPSTNPRSLSIISKEWLKEAVLNTDWYKELIDNGRKFFYQMDVDNSVEFVDNFP